MTSTVAAVLERPEQLVLREFELPQLGPDDGLLEMELAGICGTDWKVFHGKIDYPLPLILGHEILGRISAQGEGFAARYGLSIGDRVVVEGAVPCWACMKCHSGSYRFCKTKHSYGTLTSSATPPHLWGGMGGYMYLAPGSIIHKISPAVPAEAAVLVTGVIGNGIQWTRILGGAQPGQLVVIQGSGPQGLACALAARESGADRIVVTGLTRDAARLELAAEFGASHAIDVEKENILELVRDLSGGEMADLVVDVSGSPKSLPTSIDLVRTQGTLVLAGLTGKGTLTPLEVDTLVWNEVKVQGAFTKGAQAVHDAIKLVESRKYPLEAMITHRFPLGQAAEAIRAIGGEMPGVYPIKAAVEPR